MSAADRRRARRLRLEAAAQGVAPDELLDERRLQGLLALVVFGCHCGARADVVDPENSQLWVDFHARCAIRSLARELAFRPEPTEAQQAAVETLSPELRAKARSMSADQVLAHPELSKLVQVREYTGKELQARRARAALLHRFRGGGR